MATAAADTDDLFPLRRRNSFEFLPPHMSELRVVLLGNSWSERSSVGNFILGETEFNTEEEPDGCLRVRRQMKEKDIVLINTPDLLSPHISEDRLTEHVTDCVRLSDPGPHVFLLVLQPEDFSEEHKLSLCRVLKRFSDRSFDHSLILISSPREQGSKYTQYSPLKDMIRECRYRYVEQMNLELPELLTRLGQIVKEHDGENVRGEMFMDPTDETQSTHQRKTRPGSIGAVAAGPPANDDITLSGENLADPKVPRRTQSSKTKRTRTLCILGITLGLLLGFLLLKLLWCPPDHTAVLPEQVRLPLDHTPVLPEQARLQRQLSRVPVKQAWLQPDLTGVLLEQVWLQPDLTGVLLEQVWLQPDLAMVLLEQVSLRWQLTMVLLEQVWLQWQLTMVLLKQAWLPPDLTRVLLEQVRLQRQLTMVLLKQAWLPPDLTRNLSEQARLPTDLPGVQSQQPDMHSNSREAAAQPTCDTAISDENPDIEDQTTSPLSNLFEDEPRPHHALDLQSLNHTSYNTSLQHDGRVNLSRSFEFLPPDMSELRVVLLGNSSSERSAVGDFILSFHEYPFHCQERRGQLQGKDIVLINTPDLGVPSLLKMNTYPGPHVFLLVLQPEDFTEDQESSLCEVLESLSDRSYYHSLILISTPKDESPGFMERYRQRPPLKDMIKKCHYRYLWQKNLELQELLTRFNQIVRENNGEHLNIN